MVFKPLEKKVFLKYIKSANWSLEKGGIDWNLYDENNVFLCSIKIAHGRHAKEEIVAIKQKNFLKRRASYGLLLTLSGRLPLISCTSIFPPHFHLRRAA